MKGGAGTRDDESESVEFQLPLLGLYADLELGRGSVRLPDEFTACSSAVQIEVLDHWIAALAASRDAVLATLYRELVGTLADLEPAERLTRFRLTCATLGIRVPDDFSPPADPRG